MKRLLLTLILIHLSIIVYAEETDISIRVDSILNRIQLLDKSETTSLYKDLRKCHTPIKIEKDRISWRYQDSIENIRRIAYADSVKIIKKSYQRNKRSAQQLLNIGKRYYNLHSQIADVREQIIRHREDSILQLLALDCYIKAYKQTDNNDIICDALNKIGEILHLEKSDEDALALFKYALEISHGNKILEIESLWGIIRCTDPGATLIDRETAQNLLPIYARFTQLYIGSYPQNIDNIITYLSELGYISKVAGNKNYVDYCQMAISMANKYDRKYAILLRNILTNIGYYKSPNVILGDYYASIGDYDKALEHFNTSAHIVEEKEFVEVTPEEIFKHIKHNTGIPIYKGSYSYPIHLCKMGGIYYNLNSKRYVQYLNEAYYYSVQKSLLSFMNDISGNRNYVYKMLEYPLIAQYNNPDARWGYNAALFIKGITNSVDIDLKQIHTDENGNIDVNYRNYLSALQIYQNNPNSYNEIRLKEQEMKLLNGTIFTNYLQPLQYTYLDVYNSIKGSRTYAVEFVATPKWGGSGEIYYAIIISPNNPLPIKVELGNYEDFITLVATSPINQKLKDETTYLKLLDFHYKIGYEIIWRALEPHIKEGSNVYFSSTGLLHQINVEVLQDYKGKRANEKWNLYRVSSTRELCMEKPEIDMTSAVLYGNLLYDVDSTTMVAQSRTYRQEDNYVASRGFVQDSTMRNGWKKLDATNTEINSIAITMQNSGIEPTIYRLEAGNEESFKALSGKKTPIIHLATHGFFYKDEEAKTKTFFETLDMNKNNYALDNSLKRSGLILAGAQKAWLGEPIPDNVEDGVLLAEEIATMDLTGTDLVVLSACETGLGEITSEGVFGLQRAFKKAGVQTLIMSLWKVDDNATSLFMRTFYKQWLGGKSKHAAFLDAQAAVRECKESDYSNPYYWASFIMLD